MREVFSNVDAVRVGFFRSVLEKAGIPSYVRNEYSHNSAEGLQSPAMYPTLCVLEDGDYDEAMRLLGEICNEDATVLPDWACPKCAAEVPGNFDACWQCGSFREGLDVGPE